MTRLAKNLVALLSLVGAATFLWEPVAFAFQVGPEKKGEQKRRPALEYEKFRRVREVDIKMADLRQSVREKIRKLLELEGNPKERPDLLSRLADNYFEEATVYFNQAQEEDEKLAKDPQNERVRAQVDAAKKQFKVEEDKWRNKATELYREVIDKYPQYPKRDDAMFVLAFSLWDMDQQKEALSVCKELIKAYPKSKYVPDCYLQFAEYYFSQATKESVMLEKALMAYKKVAEYEDSPVYPYAIYKQAWCYYNLRECEKAKDMFQTVIYLEDMGSDKKKKRFEIRKEALKDFTLTYSQEGCGSADEAPTIFRKLAPKEAPEMLVNLAGMYFGSGQDKKAIILYRYLIKDAKCSPEVPFFQGRVVDCASRLGSDGNARRYTIKQVRELVDQFKKTKECVKNPAPKDQEKIREAQDLAELTLRKLCSQWYKEGKETKQRETFLYSQEMCGDYLELFPNTPDAYDMRFAFAEMLYHRLGQYERAAFEYAKVVAQDLAYLKEKKAFPTGKPAKEGRSNPGAYLCDAAYKSVLANRELMKEEQRKEKKKEKKETPQGKEKQVIPKNKKRLIQSAEIYLDHCPKDQDQCSVQYDIAKTYYDYNHFDEAVKRFDQIVSQCAQDELAEYSANFVLDTFNLKQDWENLNTYSRRYFKNDVLMKNDKLRDYLKKLIPQIAFKRINDLEKILKQPKKGERALSEVRINQRVAKTYIRFAKEFKDHELADDALFNASVWFERAERLDLARKARQLLIDEYQNSDLVPGTIFNLAENFERMAEFDKAAGLYETYASRYKKMAGLGKAVSYKDKRKKKGESKEEPKKPPPEQRSDGNRRTWNTEDAEAALLNAGIYREALQQFPQAIQDREEFADLFPNSPDAPKVTYSLGLLFEKLKKYPKSAEVFDKYANQNMRTNPDRAIAARMKRGLVLLKMKRWREAEKDILATLNSFRKVPAAKRTAMVEAAEAAAHAEFIRAEPTYNEYVKYRFTSAEPRKLALQLAEKSKRLEKVQRVFTEIVKLKQAEWAIASLYKLGRAYEDFAETFYKAPIPAGLTPEQKQVYMDALRQKGQPFEDKAVAHFEAAVAKGSELGFYSAFSQKALEKLQQYRSDKYPREDLGFELAVVADVAGRGPMLTATWDEVQKNPELLNEGSLRTERQPGVEMPAPPGEVKAVAPPEGGGSAPVPQPEGQPAAEPAEKGESDKKTEEAKTKAPPPEPSDPAAEAEEPSDDF